VLERVVVVLESLLGVEGRIEVGELDLAYLLARELRQLAEARQGVERVTADKEVVLRPVAVGGGLPDRIGIVEEPNLGDAVVGRLDPGVAARLVREQPEMLVVQVSSRRPLCPLAMSSSYDTGQTPRPPPPQPS
jgi:hypothetical protein